MNNFLAIILSRCKATTLPDKWKAILHSINAATLSSCKATWAAHTKPHQAQLNEKGNPENERPSDLVYHP